MEGKVPFLRATGRKLLTAAIMAVASGAAVMAGTDIKKIKTAVTTANENHDMLLKHGEWMGRVDETNAQVADALEILKQNQETIYCEVREMKDEPCPFTLKGMEE